jgi:hypothetical protein
MTGFCALVLAFLITLPLGDEALVASLPFAGVAAVIAALYLTFFRWRITVEVDNTEIIFFRGSNPYLTFRFGENIFSSSVNTTTYNFVFKMTDYFLRVFPNGEDNFKDYKLYNFSESDFEEFISYVKSFEFKEEMQQTNEDNISQEKQLNMTLVKLETNPLKYTVDKEEYVRRTRKTFVNLSVSFTILSLVFAFWLVAIPFLTEQPDAAEMLVFHVGLLAMVCLFFAAITFALAYRPYANARDNTPNYITISHDRISFDGRVFMFHNLNKIRMTSPNTSGEKSFKRVLTIFENNGQTVFALGDDSDSRYPQISKKRTPIFEDYDGLFYSLELIFAARAQRGEPSIFSADSQ